MKKYNAPVSEIFQTHTSHETMAVEASYRVNDFKGTVNIEVGDEDNDDNGANTFSKNLWEEQ